MPEGRFRNPSGKETPAVHDVYKVVKQLWLAVLVPAAVTLALLTISFHSIT